MPGLLYLGCSMTISATIILNLGLGRRQTSKPVKAAHPLIDEEADSMVEPA